MNAVCAWCGAHLGTRLPVEDTRTTHGICESCLEGIIDGDAMATCPLMVPQGRRVHESWPLGIYCRLPGGRVCVPPREHVTIFCATGRWINCPTYLAGMHKVRKLTGLA